MGKKTKPSACEGEDGVDLISDLGDDLLLRILGLLPEPDARDLAGLSALSRRWRDLSTRSPTLHLQPVHLTSTDKDDETLKRFNAFIDDVLERRVCSIDTLKMDILLWPGRERAGLWLRRAMELVVKSLHLYMSLPRQSIPNNRDCKLRLPGWTRAAEISLYLDYATLRLPAVVEFNALTDLSLWVISLARGDSGRLGRLLSSPCCPRLPKLDLCYVYGLEELQLDARALEILKLDQLADLRRLDLVTPRLSSLDVGSSVMRSEPSNFTIRAPVLERLQCSLMLYPHEIEIHYRLNIQLLQSCTSVRRHIVELHVPGDIDLNEGDNVMVEIPQLPHVTNLKLDFWSPDNHMFGACVSSILARCSNPQYLSLGIGKLLRRCDEECCICGRVGTWKEDKISMDHLREVEFSGFSGQECHDMAHLLLLNSPALQRMTVVVEASGDISCDDSSDDESPPCQRKIMETSVSTLPRPRGKWRARALANKARAEYEWTPEP